MAKFKSYLEKLEFDPALWNTLQAKWVTNIRLVILLIILVVAVGIVSIFTLPRRLNPEVQIPIITVSTVLPGAGPEDIESLVTRPLEDSVLGMDKLDTVTSSSRDNVSVMVLQFLSTVNKDKARDDVQALIDTVSLPDDAQTPKVSTIDFENEPVWTFSISSKSDTASLMRFSDRLKESIEDLPHVKNVDVAGFETQEVTVSMNPEKMREYGISAFTLSQAVSKAASSYPAGTLNTNDSTFALTIDPAITTVQDLRSIKIKTQDTEVSLGDIAAVTQKTITNQARSFVATHDKKSQQAITFYVYKSSSANIDDTAHEVVVLVNKMVKEHAGEFTVTSVLNAGDEITKQYLDLLGDFQSTVILVFINLLLFLGLRQALLASLTIPLTFLSGLIFLKVFGLTINFISLFAFLLALGTSIDDTIVTVSSMTSYYRTGKFSPQETGLLVWRDFIVPIWSTTITTIWAFLPLLLTTGIIGEFIKAIPIVVTATMISSTLYAVTVTLPLLIVILKPNLAHRVTVMMRVIAIGIIVILLFAFIPKTPIFPLVLIAALLFFFVVYRIRSYMFKKSRLYFSDRPALSSFMQKTRNVFSNGLINTQRLGRIYQRVITNILASKNGRRNTIIIVVAFALFSYLLVPLGLVKNEFFPKTDADLLYINLDMPAGTNSDIVETEILKVADTVRSIPESIAVISDVGRSYTGENFSQNSSSAVVTLLLKPVADRKKTSITLAEELRKQFKNYNNGTLTVRELSGGPPAGSDIQIKILGDDLSVIDRYADRIVQFLQSQNGVSDVSKSVKPGTSKLVFIPDDAKLAEQGIGREQIGLLLRSYASGFSLDKIRFEDKETEVTFRIAEDKPTPQQLSTLAVQTQTGSIPLSALGSLKLESNPTIINREDGKRTISVSAGVKPGFNVGDVNKKLEQFAAQKLNLPEGYEWKTGGVNEENAKSIQSIFQAMGLSFLLILVTMVIQFGSYRQAAIVLLLIPLAISGVFIVFAITATPLSFPALIGILALFGVVVTNAMFIVDKVNRNKKEGMDLEHAIADAAESRLEPIMLTSLTTIFGLVPITISDPLWRGLGGAIISGLSFSGIIMLFFVPVVYYSWFKEKTVSIAK